MPKVLRRRNIYESWKMHSEQFLFIPKAITQIRPDNQIWFGTKNERRSKGNNFGTFISVLKYLISLL